MNSSFDITEARQVTQAIFSAGIILQGMECFVARSGFGRAAGPLSWVFAARSALAALLLFPIASLSPWLATIGHLLLLSTSGWLAAHLRGPLCGGSDSMFFQVQLGLLAGSLGFLAPWLPKAGLAWIAAQSVLSYFLSGIAKARNRRWRTGTALRALLKSAGPYNIPAAIRRRVENPASQRGCAVIAWFLIAFELSFPGVLLAPDGVQFGFIAMGFCFHAINGVVLGLNRFVWAWTATYAAILWW